MQMSPLSPCPPVLALFRFLVCAPPQSGPQDGGSEAVRTGTGSRGGYLLIASYGDEFLLMKHIHILGHDV